MNRQVVLSNARTIVDELNKWIYGQAVPETFQWGTTLDKALDAMYKEYGFVVVPIDQYNGLVEAANNQCKCQSPCCDNDNAKDLLENLQKVIELCKKSL